MSFQKLAAFVTLMVFASQGAMAVPQYAPYPYGYGYGYYPPPAAAPATKPQSVSDNALATAGGLIGSIWGAAVPGVANGPAIQGASRTTREEGEFEA